MDPELKQALESMEERLNRRIDERVGRLDERMGKMDERMGKMDERMGLMDERIEKVETTLLKEFRKWAVPIHYRIKALEQLNERVLLLEERMGELEHPENGSGA